jgi:hypothetical protein
MIVTVFERTGDGSKVKFEDKFTKDLFRFLPSVPRPASKSAKTFLRYLTLRGGKAPTQYRYIGKQFLISNNRNSVR